MVQPCALTVFPACTAYSKLAFLSVTDRHTYIHTYIQTQNEMRSRINCLALRCRHTYHKHSKISKMVTVTCDNSIWTNCFSDSTTFTIPVIARKIPKDTNLRALCHVLSCDREMNLKLHVINWNLVKLVIV